MSSAQRSISPLVVLGAGHYQVPLIEAAKNRGFEVIVVSPEGEYPGLSLADECLHLDTRDAPNILTALETRSIQGVVTCGTDVAVPSMGFINDHLGLPGVSFEAAKRSSNKILFRQTLAQNGVDDLFFSVAKREQDLVNALDMRPEGLMVKAPDSSGSRGVVKVSSQKMVSKAWHEATNVSKGSSILLEEVIDGVEFGAQVIVADGKQIFLFHDDDLYESHGRTVPVGHWFPCSLDKEVLANAEIKIKRAIAALGIGQSICNVDLIARGKDVYILEIGARIGATSLPELVSRALDIAVYDVLIDLATKPNYRLDRIPEIKQNLQFFGGVLFSEKTGFFKGISNKSDQLLVRTFIKEGEEVRRFTIGPDALGIVTASASSREEIQLERDQLRLSINNSGNAKY